MSFVLRPGSCSADDLGQSRYRGPRGTRENLTTFRKYCLLPRNGKSFNWELLLRVSEDELARLADNADLQPVVMLLHAELLVRV